MFRNERRIKVVQRLMPFNSSKWFGAKTSNHSYGVTVTTLIQTVWMCAKPRWTNFLIECDYLYWIRMTCLTAKLQSFQFLVKYAVYAFISDRLPEQHLGLWFISILYFIYTAVILRANIDLKFQKNTKSNLSNGSSSLGEKENHRNDVKWKHSSTTWTFPYFAFKSQSIYRFHKTTTTAKIEK